MASVPEKEVKELLDASQAFLRAFARMVEERDLKFVGYDQVCIAERHLDECAQDVDWRLNAAP